MSECNPYVMYPLTSYLLAVMIFNIQDRKSVHLYGRYLTQDHSIIYVPAKIGWFVMELPSFLVPVISLYQSGSLDSMRSKFLLFMFCGHYFHRVFIYGCFTRGQAVEISFVLKCFTFCALNGYLQGQNLIYCTEYDNSWTTDFRFLFGGLFEYVSAANYFSEIVEWFGYSIATWTFPAFAFAIFTAVFLESRAVYHHRFYMERFKDYPKSRKILIPFLF
ncbi:3-oxo-5-alpha-steroid 4-dehydrogenase 2-like [Rhincodon typus]|uniref:3-oxo-5-alpha-steroid 4-dehydrogenase 2-like n=1 Tax=Rhincodon typus TaxID=259920 RepID=UPI0020302ED5|nr:3-oxo-5-alpha-steroid 4-dehydrogenase 2-like [Rhincodon typus]